MGHVDDFLNRLAQHAQAQKDRIDPGQANDPVAAAKWVVNMFLQPSRAALDTVGLGLEGSAKLGNYAAGEATLGIAQAQLAAQRSGVLGMDPNDPHTARQNAIAQSIVDQGAAHPQAALDAARNSGDRTTSWLAGALAMGMDPSNLIPLPVGGKLRAGEEAARAARASASFGGSAEGQALRGLLDGFGPGAAIENYTPEEIAKFSSGPAVEKALATSQMQPALEDILAKAPGGGTVPGPDPYADAIKRLTAKPDLEAIFRRADAVKNLPDLNAGVDQAQAGLDQATRLYKDVQGQKLAAVNDVKAQFDGGGGRVSKWSPEQLQVIQADPEVSRLSQMIDSLKQSNASGPTAISSVSGQAVTQKSQSLKGLGFQLSAARKKALTKAGLPTEGQTASLLDPLVEEAKTAVTALNPDGPRRGETFSEFLRPHHALVAQVKADQKNAVGEIRNALMGGGDSPTTPQEAAALSATPETLPAGDLRGELPGELNARYNQLPGGPGGDVTPTKWLDPDPKVQAALDLDPRSPRNALNNLANSELDPATGQPVATSRPGWFKTDFDPTQVPNNPIAQEATAVANPVKAQDDSNPLAEGHYLGHMLDMFKTVAEQGWTANKASFSQPWKKLGLQDVAGLWAGVNVDSFKNLFSDKLFSHFVLANEGIAARAMTSNEKLMAYRIAQGETKPWLLMGRVGDYAERLGLNVEDPKFAKTFADNLGASMYELEADTAAHLDEMNGIQKAIGGTLLQMSSPTRAVTSLLTAPFNLVITMRHHMFHVFDNVFHTSARVAAFDDAFLPLLENSAKDFLGRAEAEGLDVSPLRGMAMTDVTDKAGGVLASEGFFSPEKVREVLGDRYAAEWQATVDYAFQKGFERSKEVMGNYQLDGALGNAEKMVRKFVPFMSWAWRAFPRAGKYALQHPAVTIGLLHLLAVDRQMAQAEGRPGYQVGTIGINKDTPFVGLLASTFTPEQEATVRLNPLALFSPLGGGALSLGMDDGNPPENVYQQATKALDVVGGSFNPLIQTAAYVTGADYKAPGNASRYSPIDQYLGNATGVAEVPTIQGPLRGARKAVTSVLPAGTQADNYDPVEAKAKELVYEETGQPLEALGPNSQYAKEIATKTGIYKRAEADYLKGGAIRASVNAASPASLTATTTTTEARRAAGDPPFSYNDLQAAKDQGLVQVVKLMQAANDQFYAANPAAAVNRDAPKATGPGSSTDPRVAAWESEHVALKKLAPNSYALALKDYKSTLGIR
jgi:hypothetical protein